MFREIIQAPKITADFIAKFEEAMVDHFVGCELHVDNDALNFVRGILKDFEKKEFYNLFIDDLNEVIFPIPEISDCFKFEPVEEEDDDAFRGIFCLSL